MNGLSYIRSDARQKLLLLIKHRGTVSINDAVGATGMSRTNVREHLRQLERDGIIAGTPKRRGRGRPSIYYSLHPDAEGLFPSRDGELLGELLDFIERSGDKNLIRDFFQAYWEKREREIRDRLQQKDVSRDPASDGAKLGLLDDVLHEQGFMPEIERGENGIVIRECNCPFTHAVGRTRLPCRLEARFLERVVGRPLKRVSYIPDGSPACTYEFAPDPPG